VGQKMEMEDLREVAVIATKSKKTRIVKQSVDFS
jgi:hypothetical protein